MACPGEAAALRPLVLSAHEFHLGRRYHMKKYVIERPIPGVGSLDRDQLHAASTRSCVTLDELGPDIQWVQSFVTDDKMFCVYIAPSEQDRKSTRLNSSHSSISYA